MAYGLARTPLCLKDGRCADWRRAGRAAPEHDRLPGRQTVVVVGVIGAEVGALDVYDARQGDLVALRAVLPLRVQLQGIADTAQQRSIRIQASAARLSASAPQPISRLRSRGISSLSADS